MHRLAPATSCALVPMLALACGGGGRATGPIVGIGPAVYAPAPHYAGLFEDGRTWTYDVTHVSEYYDPDDPNADADGVVRAETRSTATCRVVETGVLPNGRISRIACEGLEAGMSPQDPISGVWATDPRGLWFVGEAAPGEIPAMPESEMVLSSAPVADSKIDADDEGFESALVVAETPDGWCRTASFVGGDESWIELCFSGAGVTRGSYGWAGGSVHETKFALRP